MTPSLHPQLLSAFLDGKSCATIARAFNLSVEEVLAWFESGLTQSTLRRLESLQLQQARIVSFSVLPGAADSLTNTCHTSENPLLRTRAASNLVRLGLRFSGSPSLREGVGGGSGRTSVPNLNSATHDTHTSEPPSLKEGAPTREAGRESVAKQPTANREARSLRDARRTDTPSLRQPAAEQGSPAISPPTSVSYAASVPCDPIPTSPSTDLICESLRAEFAALRSASTNALKSASRIAASKPCEANYRTESAPGIQPAREYHTKAPEPSAAVLRRRESRISSLRSSAGAIASCDAFSSRGRAPPRNAHPPPPINSAA